MDLNKLNSSGKNIRLSESAKKRIVTECSKYAKNSDSEYTDHVMTVERYKPRRFTRFAAIAASAVLIAGGTWAAVFSLNKIAPEPEQNSPGASVERYTGTAIKEPGDMYQTTFHLNEFLWNKCTGNGRLLSDTQREKLYKLFSGLTYTQIDDYELQYPNKHILEYTRNFDESHKDDYQYTRVSQDGYYSACIEGDILVTDFKSTYQRKTVNKQCYRLSENIEERFDAICNEKFSLVLDNDFYCLERDDLDDNSQSEIKAFLQSLQYEDIYTGKKSSDAVPMENAANIDLNFSDRNINNKNFFSDKTYDCKLHIHGCEFTYTVDYTNENGEQKHIEERMIAVDCDDAAAKILEIYNKAYRQKKIDKALSQFKDVFQTLQKYHLRSAAEYNYPPTEVSDEQYAALAELLNSLEYTEDRAWADTFNYKDYSKHAFKIVYNDDEHPYALHNIDIIDDHVIVEGGGFKTNAPDLYNKVKIILRS